MNESKTEYVEFDSELENLIKEQHRKDAVAAMIEGIEQWLINPEAR